MANVKLRKGAATQYINESAVPEWEEAGWLTETAVAAPEEVTDTTGETMPEPEPEPEQEAQPEGKKTATK